ncbi:MAG: class C beta-lactamase-related serine hydrolase [Proteobacteria bacterium]|nr:class C beta-lactamase-related serine hydrolase [Pseudomonadota bacterium]
MKIQKVTELLEAALRARIGSGIAASYGKIDELRNGVSPNEIYLGRHSHEPGSGLVHRNSFFDLASLTKILLTTLLAMDRVESGAVRLDSCLADLLPEYVRTNPAAGRITIRHLLTHTSGLPAWRPFYERLREKFGDGMDRLPPKVRRAYFDSLVDEVPLECGAGERVIYSDVGFLLLERALTRDLRGDAKRLFGAVPGLQLGDGADRQAVATELCPWRGLLAGTVHDDNAWSRGGLSGHAGLFGRLQDLQLWIEALFSGKWVSMRTLRMFTQTISDSSGAFRALGFDVPARDGSGSTGYCFSQDSIGHLGFTGTSLWLDLDSGDYAILLTNRVHPSRADDRIRKLRRAFHEEVRR